MLIIGKHHQNMVVETLNTKLKVMLMTGGSGMMAIHLNILKHMYLDL